jgi:ketosteroid isomerase-like protein
MDDYEQICQLTARYNLAFDTRDVDAFIACFTDDCVFRFVNTGLVLLGHKDVRHAIETTMNDGRHGTSDYIVDVTGDRAIQRCQLTELGIDDGKAVVRRFGRYVDNLVRIDGVWRFRSRELTYG